jgi:hypothetical protein
MPGMAGRIHRYSGVAGWFAIAGFAWAGIVAHSEGAEVAGAVKGVEWQPLSAQIERVFEAMDYIGSPVSSEIKATLEKLRNGTNSSEEIQRAIDPLCLFLVEINPESRVKVTRGQAAPELVENGWRPFLVKVQNEAGVTARFRAECPNAAR